MNMTITEEEKNSKITEAEYDSLRSGELTMKQGNILLEIISTRFTYIMKTICSKVEWYDYDNGYKETDGSFEVHRYAKDDEIFFEGEFTFKHPRMKHGFDGIPIKWLWQDFEEEFERSIEVAKREEQDRLAKEQAQREHLKSTKVEMKKIIQGKLTKEELRYIKFI